MSKRFRNLRRGLRLESLEPRRMMAGNVAVTYSGGAVDIAGDLQDNAIELGYDSLGRLEIRGVDNTTVNGYGSYSVANFQSIGVALSGGDDRLTVNPPPGTTFTCQATCWSTWGRAPTGSTWRTWTFKAS
jgi:hypothetical protein